MVIKKNKCAAKRKKQIAELCTLVKSPLSFCSESSLFLLPCFVPVFVPIFVFALVSAFVLASVPTPVFHSGSPAISSFYHLPTLVLCSGSPTIILSHCLPTSVRFAALSLPCHALVFCCEILAFLSLFFSILSSTLFLRSLSLRTFKRFLLDEPQLYILTTLTKPLHLFLALGAYNPDNNNGLYNPTNNNKCIWDFDIAFINSHPLAGNHDQKEEDLSFAGCECLNAIKLNRSWQLDLLNPKPVCIIKAIPLTSALFWDLTFALCLCHTMKLAFKLGLRMNKIKNDIVKKRIETIWANRTVSLLDRLFRDNLEW